MAGYSCQDCTRCSRSGFASLMRGVAAVATLGVSEAAIATSDFFKRTCPGCGHPMGEHTVARQLYEQEARARYVQPPRERYVPVPVPVPVPYPVAVPSQPSWNAGQAAPVQSCPHRNYKRHSSGVICHDCGSVWDPEGRLVFQR